MKNFTVKDLMVPLSEYATVTKGASLYEAVLALEKAQEEFDHVKYQHRAVLILDENKHVVGKLSQLDVLRALEAKDEQSDQVENIGRFGFSANYITRLKQQQKLIGNILDHIYAKAKSLKAHDYMQMPSEGEYVDEKASLDAAVHQLVSGTHLSLLVTRGKAIIGILRLSDVFAAVFHELKDSELAE